MTTEETYSVHLTPLVARAFAAVPREQWADGEILIARGVTMARVATLDLLAVKERPEPRRTPRAPTAEQRTILAAVVALGGPPGRGDGPPFWPRVAAAVGKSVYTCRDTWARYKEFAGGTTNA